LLESIIQYMSPKDIEGVLPEILKLLFTRLQPNSRTLSYITSFLIFLTFFIGKRGASYVVDKINAVQPGIFKMILSSIWIQNIQRVTGKIERKMCTIAMTKLLTDCPFMVGDGCHDLWLPLLETNIKMFTDREDVSSVSDFQEAPEVDEEKGYSGVFSQLVHAAKPEGYDPFPEISAFPFFVQSLNQLTLSQPQIKQTVSQVNTKYGGILNNYKEGNP